MRLRVDNLREDGFGLAEDFGATLRGDVREACVGAGLRRGGFDGGLGVVGVFVLVRGGCGCGRN